MGFEYRIRTVESRKDIDNLRKFMLDWPFHYPDYENWVEKSVNEILMGYKTGIVAYYNRRVVGNGVFQPHKELKRFREIKNMRVDPNFRRLDVAHFTMRQIEEFQKKDYDSLICDAPAEKPAIHTFLRFCGFNELYKDNLYSGNSLDAIFVKHRAKNEFNR